MLVAESSGSLGSLQELLKNVERSDLKKMVKGETYVE